MNEQPDNLYVKFPILKTFKQALAKNDPRGPAQSFAAWMAGKKCPPGSPQRAEAERLWAQYEQWRRQNAGSRAAPPAGGRFPPGWSNTERRGGFSSTKKTVRGAVQPKADNATAAPPDCLDAAFHNPYTFIPFPDPEKQPLCRRKPTPLTIDEIETDRMTGVLELTVRTLSPLMTCHPDPVSDQNGHKTYRALRIGPDVIVPATGIKGALRTLMTILTGGTLGYVDDGLWLCQGRDAQLGPAGQNSPEGTPKRVFLARVIRPGNAAHDGTVELGDTRLVRREQLDAAIRRCGLDIEKGVSAFQPTQTERPMLWASGPDLRSLSQEKDSEHPWQVKVSGRPVNRKNKREGLFKGNGRTITLPRELWAAYQGRNRHGLAPELRKGDLVWLEPADPNCEQIRSAGDVKSIQWARWGRHGQKLLDLLWRHHPQVIPDSWNSDGLVDEVTDLFGQVPMVPGAAGPFAARIRPENLVFYDAADKTRTVTLAPLAPPHPGCIAFYRDNDDLDAISVADPLRGYKVYRTTSERGDQAPWLYKTQGVYDSWGNLRPPKQKVNKTCELLWENLDGRLRIAFRALTRRELALLLAACTVDWRLGGGKPLGLGHCRVVEGRIILEDGSELLSFERHSDDLSPLPPPFEEEVQDIRPRMRVWQLTQKPVPRLRYPRAVEENRNRKSRGGHVWFQRHAAPRKAGTEPRGLQVLWVDGDLRTAAGGKNQIQAQRLPKFDPDHPEGDRLYGYDLFSGDNEEFRWKDKNKITWHRKLEPFDPQKHARPTDHSGGFHGQNAESRQKFRGQRRRDYTN